MTFMAIQKEKIDNLVQGINQLLDNCSIKDTSYPGVIDVRGDYRVSVNNSDEAYQSHSKLFKDFTSLKLTLNLLVYAEPEETKRNLQKFLLLTETFLGSKSMQTGKSRLDVLKSLIISDWEKVIRLFSGIYTESLDEIIIPDTSYILNNPDFLSWEPLTGSNLYIILPPIVLQEIDKVKEFHKNPDINKTAKEIARKLLTIIKNPTDGNSIRIIAKYQEPKSTILLGDLDLSVPDDRFLASVFDIIREYSNSNCYIATDDINLANKAIHYGIPVKD